MKLATLLGPVLLHLVSWPKRSNSQPSNEEVDGRTTSKQSSNFLLLFQVEGFGFRFTRNEMLNSNPVWSTPYP